MINQQNITIQKLYMKGMPISDICSALDISRTTLYERLKSLDVPRTRNKDRESSKSRIEALRAHVKEHLENNPCEVCGFEDWRALQFDHLDRSQKAFTIGHILRKSATTYVSTLRLAMEIEKCRVLCANCHQMHTSKQMGFWRAL